MTDFKLSIDNGIRAPAPGVMLDAVRTIEGRIVVDFDSPGLADWLKREQGRVENVLLRMARPHMTRRGYRRFRGRWKARPR